MPYFLERLKKHAGRRGIAARQHADGLRVADGQPERAQPQALPAVPRRQGGRAAQGRAAHQGARRDADGERVPDDGAHAGDERPVVVRRQHRRVRHESPVGRATTSAKAASGVIDDYEE